MTIADIVQDPGFRYVLHVGLGVLVVLAGCCWLMHLAGRIPPCEHCGGKGKTPARGDDGRETGSYYHCDCHNTIR